jgi:hypothetical protein
MGEDVAERSIESAFFFFFFFLPALDAADEHLRTELAMKEWEREWGVVEWVKWER